MAYHFTASLCWTGAGSAGTAAYDAYSREHLIEIEGKPPLRGSSAPAFRGDPGRHNPEDLLLASLAACHMLWYLHLAAEAGIVVTAYRDRASATMAMKDGRMRFTEVTLRPEVTVLEGDPEQALALHGAANRACFIANSVNFPVRHEPVANPAPKAS
jgi:organic hydroperoxide reductase OsmC/OhrA